MLFGEHCIFLVAIPPIRFQIHQHIKQCFQLRKILKEKDLLISQWKRTFWRLLSCQRTFRWNSECGHSSNLACAFQDYRHLPRWPSSQSVWEASWTFHRRGAWACLSPHEAFRFLLSQSSERAGQGCLGCQVWRRKCCWQPENQFACQRRSSYLLRYAWGLNGLAQAYPVDGLSGWCQSLGLSAEKTLH